MPKGRRFIIVDWTDYVTINIPTLSLIQALLMEGADVDIFPSSLTLPVGSELSPFVLVSVPRQPGIITVLGKA